jgi:hypothetical protein
MKVAIYGHSQAQPTGMGDDLIAELKKRKITTHRVGLQGRSDAGLMKEIDKLGDVSDCDKIVLYCGGNDSKIPDTIKLIQHFGSKRVIAVLPPINLDRLSAGNTNEQKLEKSKNYQAALRGMVQVFQITNGKSSDFKKDEIHLRSGTVIGKNIAVKIADAVEGKFSISSIQIAIASVAIIGFLLFMRNRK